MRLYMKERNEKNAILDYHGSNNQDENIRYIRRYIFYISDIGDVRHDIDDDRYIVEILGLWHTPVLV